MWPGVLPAPPEPVLHHRLDDALRLGGHLAWIVPGEVQVDRGPEVAGAQHAGGIVDDTTTARGARLGLAPPAVFLAASDTRNYLGPLGDLILTGPTGTNVADIVTLIATPPGPPRL